MVPIWLAIILAVAGFVVWMLTKKDFHWDTNWKEVLRTAVVVTVAWLIWWQVGLPFLNWQAGVFNVGVFGLAWFVPSILDHLIPKKK